jgi:hypothetical protein
MLNIEKCKFNKRMTWIPDPPMESEIFGMGIFNDSMSFNSMGQRNYLLPTLFSTIISCGDNIQPS